MSEALQFELIVKDLLKSELVQTIPADALKIEQDAHFIGKSGHNHQIDVAAEFRVAGVKVLILVECKKYSHKVGIDEVMEFATRIDDIGAHKGILVTTVGFQTGAVKMANSKGIALVLAVDLKWSVDLESPMRELHLAELFAIKAQAQSHGSLSETEVVSLYRHSIEANRGQPLECGELFSMQEAQTRKERLQNPQGVSFCPCP